MRSTVVSFLDQVRAGLDVNRMPLIAQSVGGLWSLWLALDRPMQLSALLSVTTVFSGVMW